MKAQHIHIISRATAKALGLKRYFTAIPCKSGHVSERYTGSPICIECLNRTPEERIGEINKESERREAEAYRILHESGLPIYGEVLFSRESAIAAGSELYLDGVSCRRWHLDYRLTKTAECIECKRLAKKKVADKDRAVIDNKYKGFIADWISSGKHSKQLHIMQKSDAENVSSRFYLSPYPCVNGHWSERRTSNSQCVECEAAAQKTDSAKQYQKEYSVANPEKMLTYCATYREKHRERRNANNARWRADNIDFVRASIKNVGHKRRCQKASGVTAKELKTWQDKQKKICYWCDKSCKKSFHIDHYVPLSKGGEHKLENLVIACPTCNLTKSAKDPYAFAKSVGRLF